MAQKKTTASTKTKTASQSTARKTIAPKRTTAAKKPKMETLKVYKNPDFMKPKVSEQTVYWLIIGLAVMMLGLWMLKVQREVMDIYDQIDLNSALIESEIQSSAVKSAESAEQAPTE